LKVTLDIEVGARETPLSVASHIEETIRIEFREVDVLAKGKTDGTLERKFRAIKVVRVEE
jgi:hypothetical protein